MRGAGRTGRLWWRPGDCGVLPGGQVAALRRKGPAYRPAGRAKMFSQRAIKKGSAGAAGTQEGPRPGEKISGPPEASAARGRLREPTKRRKLTKPGKGQPAVQVPPPAAPGPVAHTGKPRTRHICARDRFGFCQPALATRITGQSPSSELGCVAMVESSPQGQKHVAFTVHAWHNPSTNQIHLAPVDDEIDFIMAVGMRTSAYKLIYESLQSKGKITQARKSLMSRDRADAADR